ncbi:hypothetical protein ACHQM5_010241 [Ranunculus cassubicifolius]
MTNDFFSFSLANLIAIISFHTYKPSSCPLFHSSPPAKAVQFHWRSRVQSETSISCLNPSVVLVLSILEKKAHCLSLR